MGELWIILNIFQFFEVLLKDFHKERPSTIRCNHFEARLQKINECNLYLSYQSFKKKTQYDETEKKTLNKNRKKRNQTIKQQTKLKKPLGTWTEQRNNRVIHASIWNHPDRTVLSRWWSSPNIAFDCHHLYQRSRNILHRCFLSIYERSNFLKVVSFGFDTELSCTQTSV